jgi:hypothetical protein
MLCSKAIGTLIHIECQFETFVPTKKQLLPRSGENSYLQIGDCRVNSAHRPLKMERNVLRLRRGSAAFRHARAGVCELHKLLH